MTQRRFAAILFVLEGSLGSVPVLIVAGLIAYAPMGEGMSGIGTAAAFLSGIVGAGFVAAIADRRGLMAGPSLGLALMVSAALAALLRQGVIAADDIGAAMAVTAVLTVGCGGLMAGVAALGVGRLAPLIPYPVLAGLRNGTAVLLVLEQRHAAMGLEEGGHGVIHPGALAVTAVTAAAMLVRIPGLRGIPPIVLALVAGAAAQHVLAGMPALAVGPVMMPELPGLAEIAGFGHGAMVLLHLPEAGVTGVLLPTMATMAVFGVLETVACASALHGKTGQRSSGRRDLLAVALANAAGGLLGALPAAGSLEETVPAAADHGERQALLWRGMFLVLLAGIALSGLAHVPAAVLAGVILVSAYEVSDIASLRQMLVAARRGRHDRVEGIGNPLIVVAVAAIAATAGLVAAVAVGVLLALVVFVADMAQGPIRRVYVNPLGRSRTRRGERESETLLREGAAITVIELQGALFFGSTDQVAGGIEAALGGGGRYVVLDLHRIHRMDLSGARGLIGTCERLWRAGHWLVLAGMRKGVPAWDYLDDRGLHGHLPAERVFPTLEDAIESAEMRLLADRLGTVADPALSGAEALTGLGIPGVDVAALLGRMVELRYRPGEAIIRTGELSRALYVLLAGRVDVTLPVRAAGTARAVRVATLAPGTLFGEMALLSSAPRSADLTAHGEVVCLRLDFDGLAALRAGNPDSAWHLLRAIAARIEMNLRLANAAIASYEE